MNQPYLQQLNTNLFKPSSAVIYSKDFEPISHVPMNTQMYEYFMKYEIVRFPVQLPITLGPPKEEAVSTNTLYAEISAMRVHSADGIRLILVARDDTTALLMNSTFMPGQTKEINYIKTKSFFQGMIKAMKEKK